MSDYITTVFDITLLILGFTVFVVALLEMKNSIIVKNKFLINIFQNDMTGLLMEIEGVRNICDEENDFEFLLNTEFTGIKEGSYNKNSNKFSDDPCQSLDKNCINIPAIPPTTLRAWEDKVVCVKRMKLSEIPYKIVSKNSECPEEFRMCGAYNSFGDKLCLDELQKCPINFIKFTDDLAFVDKLDRTIYKIITLNLGKYLVYSNELVNHTYSIDFKISENFPCIETERISVNETFKIFNRTNDYKLMGCNSKIDEIDDGYDKRYYIYATDKKDKVLAYNDLLNKYDKLPNVDGWINDARNNFYHIYVRGYISLDYTCSDHKKFLDFKSSLDELKDTIFHQLCYCVINVFVLLIFIVILSLFKLFRSWYKLFIRFLKICYSSLFILYIFNRKIKTEIILSSMENYQDEINKCGDKYINLNIKRYGIPKNLEEFSSYERTMIILVIISVVVIFILLLCLIYKTYVRFKNTSRRKVANFELGHGSKSFLNDTIYIYSPFKSYKVKK
jgi:hypothetical protein